MILKYSIIKNTKYIKISIETDQVGSLKDGPSWKPQWLIRNKFKIKCLTLLKPYTKKSPSFFQNIPWSKHTIKSDIKWSGYSLANLATKNFLEVVTPDFILSPYNQKKTNPESRKKYSTALPPFS